jgi:hypothetical protein
MHYTFDFLPIKREKIDVLESLLIDAQDEIKELKDLLLNNNKHDFKIISMQTTAQNALNDYISWNKTDNNTDDKLFVQSKDKKTITITESGFSKFI